MKFLQGQLLSLAVLACAVAPQAYARAAPKPEGVDMGAGFAKYLNRRQASTTTTTTLCPGDVTVTYFTTVPASSCSTFINV